MLFSERKTEFDRWAERLRGEGMEQGLERGMEQGLERGMEQGLERGKRALVRKQLMLRFGALPADAERRLDRASPAELELWAERVLTADSLAAVLAD